MSLEPITLPLFALAFAITCICLQTLNRWPRIPTRTSIRGSSTILQHHPGETREEEPLNHVEPYRLPPLRVRPSSKMAMGLKRLDEANWLTIDSNSLPEHSVRRKLLETSHSQVTQCLPGSEEASHEVLNLVANFISSRFPKLYSNTNNHSKSLD